ncbi:FN3 associated domain-containing protein [Marispirochaeta sp.]|uniref:FN3 associated domain-containing protein n=1 Tax=Marispirochaeta sp. TaxID=2038653 RepID=UPI0029C81857|nr:FN3 associated domain-containing protein [Marispirochaeta sp.]
MNRSRSLYILVSLLLVFSAAGLQGQSFRLSHFPGEYRHSILLEIESEADSRIYYRFANSKSSHFIPYCFPLELSAFSGEERTYRIEVSRKSIQDANEDIEVFEYLIDKRVPPSPQAKPGPGVYSGQTKVSFAPQDDSLYYVVDESIAEDPLLWRGDAIILNERETPYRISAYTRDSAGNLSEVAAWEYVVRQKKSERLESFQIISPVEGDYLNPQFLYVRSETLSDFAYTTDGTDPRRSGKSFSGGKMLDLRGDITLSVAGKLPDGGFTEVKTLRYSVGGGDDFPGIPVSGIYRDEKNLGFRQNPVHYTFEERIPTDDDPVTEGNITLFASPRGVISYSLRFISPDSAGKGNGHYRYFYLFDTRTPEAPLISIPGTAPYAEAPVISLSAPEYSRIHYTLNGSDPDANSQLYSGPFVPPLKSREGNLMVKAVAVAPGGITGPVAGRLVPYDLVPPEPPNVTVGKQGRDASLRIDVQLDGGSQAVFETGADEASTPAISTDSPVWRGENLQLPWGMSSRRFFRFAALDKAGNLSSPVTVEAEIHRIPPDMPSISFADGEVHISGSGELYYALERSGFRDEPEDVFLPFQDPLPLKGEAEKLIEYQVKAYAEDEQGARSDIACASYEIDRRLPELPRIIGLEDRRVYNSHVLKPGFSSLEEDLDVLYSLGTDAQEPDDPDSDSPSLRDLSIETEKGREVYYHLKLRPVFPRRGRLGRVSSFRFVVDRNPPEIPEIYGLPEGGITDDEVVLRLAEMPEDVSAFLLITDISDGHAAPEESDSPETDSPNNAEAYTTPRLIEVQEGKDRTFSINISVVDAAGNQSTLNTPLQLRIDRRLPAEPKITGIPEAGKSSSPLRIELIPPEDARAEYRILNQEDIPRAATLPFQIYEGPLELSGAEGECHIMQLEYRSFDAAGNRSIKTLRKVITLDRRKTAAPADPAVQYLDSGRAAELSWNVPPGNTLFYCIGEQSDWLIYRSPVALYVSPGERAVQVQSYLQSDSGVTSAVRTINIEPPVQEGESVFVRGAKNGGIYGNQVLLEPAVNLSGAYIRYELGLNSEPAQVNSFSPLLDKTVALNVPSGMEGRFSIRMGLYTSLESRVPVSGEHLQFTIDRLPPRPPLLTEIGGRVDDSTFKQIELEGEGDRILYSLDGGEPRTEYEDAIRLDTRGKSGESVVIRATALDRTGNRSSVREWKVLLDQDIIYVSESGNDLYEGTRLKPYRSLEKALEQAQSLNLSTLYIASGSYTVQRPLVISREIKIVGGLKPETWTAEGTSLIRTGEYFPDGSEILSVRKDCSIEALRFSDPDGKVKVPVAVQNANVFIQNIDADEDSAFDYLLRQDDGVVTAADTSISRGGRRGIFLNQGGSLNISGTNLTAPANLSGDWTAVTVQDGSLEAADTEIRPGGGSRSVAIHGEGAYLNLKRTELFSGSGSRSAIALRLVRGQATIIGGRITALEAQTPTAVSAEASRLDIKDAEIALGGQNGNTGLLLRDCELRMSNSSLTTLTEAGFSFMLRQRGGRTEILNCTASLAARGEPVLLDLEGGRLSMLHSTLLVSSSRERPTGVITRGGTQLFMTNSIVSNTAGPSGTALIGEKGDPWSIRNCNFGDWSSTAEYGGTGIPDPAALNRLDGEPLAGWIDGNIAESPRQSFSGGTYRLREDSACVNAGIESGKELPDIDGQKRPNPRHGIRPFPDIGADEFYPAR